MNTRQQRARRLCVSLWQRATAWGELLSIDFLMTDCKWQTDWTVQVSIFCVMKGRGRISRKSASQSNFLIILFCSFLLFSQTKKSDADCSRNPKRNWRKWGGDLDFRVPLNSWVLNSAEAWVSVPVWITGLKTADFTLLTVDKVLRTSKWDLWLVAVSLSKETVCKLTNTQFSISQSS